MIVKLQTTEPAASQVLTAACSVMVCACGVRQAGCQVLASIGDLFVCNGISAEPVIVRATGGLAAVIQNSCGILSSSANHFEVGASQLLDKHLKD